MLRLYCDICGKELPVVMGGFTLSVTDDRISRTLGDRPCLCTMTLCDACAHTAVRTIQGMCPDGKQTKEGI